MGKKKKRGNGQGSIFLSRDGKTYMAQIVVGYRLSNKKGGQPVPVKKTKSGFKTKREASDYISTLKNSFAAGKRKNLREVFDEWEKMYSSRIVPSTMGCYRAAYKYFSTVHDLFIADISANELQKCMDACAAGKRTHVNMKCVAGLLWAFAMDCNYVEKDVTDHLYIGKHETVQRDPLTELEVETIRNVIGHERYAEYIYCLCYLGFRPGEFLSLKKEHYKVIDGIECLVNGSKTEAGKDRIVVIPPQILDLVRSRLFVPGTDLLFPQYVFSRKSGAPFIEFKLMHHSYFRDSVFKPMMARLGIAEGKVPYAARHTYSDKLKRAEGDDKTKAGLMGHTDYAFTRSHYQSTDMDDLLNVATSIE